ncbi:hypothetical protein GZ212_11410 [Mangrovimonas sp. CR14]|uniref:SdiA-regulated domain-containing protein n=1 Tax=Mangrovimonas sp. CR14 TaxID=2706120 RepID=UPI0014234CD7|nr:SdiA-regulated domain-containing protein [Mangrovimonas sp. CR14]NIK92760.1 hypothetical protein [Mangrovimonas sp. CR14]
MKIAKILILVGGLIISGLFISLIAEPNFYSQIEPKEKYHYTTIKTWDVPGVLEEISGIFWLGDQKMATIQDEDGVIFIYDLKAKKISEEIPFDKGGDYEALAIVDDVAYVMRSDGKLIEISNYMNEDRELKVYDSFFDEENDMESLTYDKKHHRLLMIAKDEDPNFKKTKGIYAFDLKSKKFLSKPVVSIDFKDDGFKDYRHKDAYKTFRPSDMAIDPKSGDYYLLEGVDPKVLILNSQGDFKSIYKLDNDDFEQPEGITFDNYGELYISNEAVNHSANIIQLRLDK